MCSLCHGGIGVAKAPAFSFKAGDALDDFLKLEIPKEDEALVWDTRWVLAPDELEAERVVGDIRFAAPLPEGETMRRLQENGLALTNEDTMAQAIHDVYCGIMADHEHPNDKDRSQARAMIDALQKQAPAS